MHKNIICNNVRKALNFGRLLQFVQPTPAHLFACSLHLGLHTLAHEHFTVYAQTLFSFRSLHNFTICFSFSSFFFAIFCFIAHFRSAFYLAAVEAVYCRLGFRFDCCFVKFLFLCRRMRCVRGYFHNYLNVAASAGITYTSRANFLFVERKFCHFIDRMKHPPNIQVLQKVNESDFVFGAFMSLEFKMTQFTSRSNDICLSVHNSPPKFHFLMQPLLKSWLSWNRSDCRLLVGSISSFV